MPINNNMIASKKTDLKNYRNSIWHIGSLYNYHKSVIENYIAANVTVLKFNQIEPDIKNAFNLNGADDVAVVGANNLLIAQGANRRLNELAPSYNSVLTYSIIALVILSIDFLFMLTIMLLEHGQAWAFVMAIVLAFAGWSTGEGLAVWAEQRFKERNADIFSDYVKSPYKILGWLVAGAVMFGLVLKTRTFRSSGVDINGAIIVASMYLISSVLVAISRTNSKIYDLCTDRMFQCQLAFQANHMLQDIKADVYEQYYIDQQGANERIVKHVLKNVSAEGAEGENQ